MAGFRRQDVFLSGCSKYPDCPPKPRPRHRITTSPRTACSDCPEPKCRRRMKCTSVDPGCQPETPRCLQTSADEEARHSPSAHGESVAPTCNPTEPNTSACCKKCCRCGKTYVRSEESRRRANTEARRILSMCVAQYAAEGCDPVRGSICMETLTTPAVCGDPAQCRTQKCVECPPLECVECPPPKCVECPPLACVECPPLACVECPPPKCVECTPLKCVECEPPCVECGIQCFTPISVECESQTCAELYSPKCVECEPNKCVTFQPEECLECDSEAFADCVTDKHVQCEGCSFEEHCNIATQTTRTYVIPELKYVFLVLIPILVAFLAYWLFKYMNHTVIAPRRSAVEDKSSCHRKWLFF